MKYSLVFLFLATSCKLNAPTQQMEPTLVAGTYRYLALGDSYTIGESVAADDRWPVQLADLLRKDQTSVASPDIVARTGWTTAELATGIDGAKPAINYDLVSLLIGVNNQYRGQSLERYRTELRELLLRCVQFADGRANRVLVLSTPDWGVTLFASGQNRAQIAREIDAFNQVQREECEKLKITLVDITPLSRTALGDASQVASDGLHFSGKMYKQWAAAALPVTKKMLAK